MAFAAFAPTYTPEPVRCSGGAKPGTVILQEWATEDSPWARDLWDVGIYVCRTIAGSSTLSAHASGRSGDSGHNIVTSTRPFSSHPSGIAFANWLVANAALLGIQEVICNRRRWDNQSKQWKTYTGVSPHIDHVHWTLNLSGAMYLTLARILSVAPQPPAPPAPPALLAVPGDTHMTLIRRIENPNQSVLILPDKTTKIGVRGFFAERTPGVDTQGISGSEEVSVDKSAWTGIVDNWLKANGALTST